MHLPTSLLLVLGTCTAALLADDAGTYHYDADTNIFHRKIYPSGLERYRTYIDTHHKERRQKRGTSSFRQAWLRLLKTTLGSQRVWIDGDVAKLYVKEGTLDDAIRDFYSLRPTRIVKNDEELTGQVGNQVIKLFQNWSPDGPRPTVFVAAGEDAAKHGVSNTNKVTKGICYCKTPAQARATLRVWQERKPSVH